MLTAAGTTTVPTWLQVAALGATVIAALAGCGSAIAAAYSARASRATSRDALEALALAIRPGLSSSFGTWSDPGSTRRAFIISNGSAFDAIDIDVEVHRRDGRTIRSTFGSLRGIAEDMSRAAPLLADAGPASLTDPPWELFREVFVRFSDERGIARYEQHHRYGTADDPPGTTQQSERRIR